MEQATKEAKNQKTVLQDTTKISTEDQIQKSEFELSVKNLKPTIAKHSDVNDKKDELTLQIEKESEPELKVEQQEEETVEDFNNVEIDIAIAREEESSTENLSDKILKDFGEFDPTLELSNFRFPTFNLLKQY